MPKKPPALIRPARAAQMLGVTRQAVNDRLRRGTLPSVDIAVEGVDGAIESVRAIPRKAVEKAAGNASHR